MIARRMVFCLGLSQLISCGVSYYVIGGLGELITAYVGWAYDTVYGGSHWHYWVSCPQSPPA